MKILVFLVWILATLLEGTLVLTSGVQPARAETIVVPYDYPTIQEAINHANTGDVIFVREGTYHENVVVNKTLSLFGSNRETTVLVGSPGEVVLYVQSDGVRISGFKIENATTGVQSNTNNVTVNNNKIVNCQSQGVQLNSVDIGANASNNYIANCLVGVLVYGTGHIVENNILENNSMAAIQLSYFRTYNNTVRGNIITHNGGSGIYVQNSFNNTISANILKDNRIGINMQWSDGNKIFHNNFVNNTVQAFAYASHANKLDNSYPSGGNYWSDYSGIDLFKGPFQNETGSDSMGDTPYVVDENNVDHYPLIKPWAPTVTVAATVEICPQALNLRSKGRWITAYIELPQGYRVEDVDVSTVRLNGSISVDHRAPVQTGGYDRDRKQDLIVKFDRQAALNLILTKCPFAGKFGTVTLTIAGKLSDRIQFSGSDTVKIVR